MLRSASPFSLSISSLVDKTCHMDLFPSTDDLTFNLAHRPLSESRLCHLEEANKSKLR